MKKLIIGVHEMLRLFGRISTQFDKRGDPTFNGKIAILANKKKVAFI